MATQKFNLTRDQLATFLKNHELIKQFEKLVQVVDEVSPSSDTTGISLQAGNADAVANEALAQIIRLAQDSAINCGAADQKATQAIDALNRIANALEMVATAPVSREDNSSAADYVDINTTAPTAVGGVPGRLKWNDTDGTLDLGLKGGNVTLQIGQENVLIVKNDEATPLVDGEVVYVSGASGANLLVKRALADSDVTSASTIGIVTEPIATNGQGYITTFGQVRGLNTSSFNEGDILYLSPTVAGQITNVKPVAPQHMVTVGYCTKKSAGNGEIFTKVDNGYEVDELHNVLITNPVLAGSLLIYDATVGVWKNARLTAGSNVAITNADGSITITVAGSPPTGTAGGVLSGTYPNPGFAVDMATQTELDAHTTNVSNPHAVTKAQVGLSNVTNDAQLKIASNLSDLANAATARTNLGVAIGTNVQAWDADLSAIAALAGTTGFLKKTAANTWTLDTSNYEPAIAAGTTAKYWRGDKSWRDFATDVRAAVLTGLSTATNAAITAADSVLSAFGKLQAQFTAHFGLSTGVHGVTGSVVGTTDSQTLSNKTLTTPTIATIKSAAVSTPTTFTDSAGTQIGTLCRAWVKFNGATGAILASFNVTSITRVGAGIYVVNLTTALPDGNAAVVGMANQRGGVTLATMVAGSSTSSTTVEVYTSDYTGALFDPNPVSVAVFR